MPIISKIQRTIGLFPGDWLRNDEIAGSLIAEGSTGPESKSEQIVGKIEPAGGTRRVARQTLSPGAIE